MRRVLVTATVMFLMAGCVTTPKRDPLNYRAPDLAAPTARTAPSAQDGLDNLKAKSVEMVDGFSAEVTDYLKKNSKKSAISKAQKTVAASLKDPSSAQFRNVRIVPYGEGSVICGEVNGKNSYGGYVGFQSFVSGINFAQIESSGGEYAHITRAANEGLIKACF